MEMVFQQHFDWNSAFGDVLPEATAIASEQLFQKFCCQIEVQRAGLILLETGAKNLQYHGIGHTAGVLWAALCLGYVRGIETRELARLALAAAYHDTGYPSGALGHEERSAEIFAESNPNLPTEPVKFIQDLIRETELMIDHVTLEIQDQEVTEIGELLLDADLSYFGYQTDSFFNGCRRLLLERTEKEYMELSNEDKIHFLEDNISFLYTHKWHSTEARELFEPQKQRNIAWLSQQVDELE